MKLRLKKFSHSCDSGAERFARLLQTSYQLHPFKPYLIYLNGGIAIQKGKKRKHHRSEWIKHLASRHSTFIWSAGTRSVSYILCGTQRSGSHSKCSRSVRNWWNEQEQFDAGAFSWHIIPAYVGHRDPSLDELFHLLQIASARSRSEHLETSCGAWWLGISRARAALWKF
jgi:hypothetical protein